MPSLEKADLRRSDLIAANLSMANLSMANLSEGYLTWANLSGANLSGTNLRGLDLHGANLSGANLSGANLSGAILTWGNIEHSVANLSVTNLRGLDLSDFDLSGAKLSGAKLSGTNLSGLDLSGLDLSGLDLSGANLSGTNLSGANLSGADLSGLDLHGANLSGGYLGWANLSGANLSGTNLSGLDLHGANLSGTNLSGANLSGTNLSGLDLSGFDLSGANLSDTILDRARIIRCQLANAVFENAEVTDCQVHETRGRPIPPGILRMLDGSTLTGEDARNFFNPPATVEVYLSEVLTDQEIGLYHFHLGEMQHRSVGTDVHLVGRRDEADGTVLRFQAPTYEQIYQMLPVLLAPFRRSRAVDWSETLQHLPGQERGLVLTELWRIEAAHPLGVWHFADRLAEGFGEFPNARVQQIRDGRHWAVRIDVATNESVAERLNAQARVFSQQPYQKNEFHLPGGTVRLSLEDRSMNPDIKAGGNVVATTGEGNVVSTGDVVFQQVWNKAGSSIDLPKLADELARLDTEMQKEAKEPEHRLATANVSMAEKAAKEGNGPKALEYLKAAGQWALDTATKIGVSVASDALDEGDRCGQTLIRWPDRAHFFV